MPMPHLSRHRCLLFLLLAGALALAGCESATPPPTEAAPVEEPQGQSKWFQRGLNQKGGPLWCGC